MEELIKYIQLEKIVSKTNFDLSFFTFSYKDFITEKKFPFKEQYCNHSAYHVFFYGSSFNETYEGYLGADDFHERAKNCISILQEKGQTENTDKDYYEIISLLDCRNLFEQEKNLYELILLFKFSTFVFIDKTYDFSVIKNNFKRRSLFKSNFGFDKWKAIGDLQFFFDAEHFAGKISISHKYKRLK